MKKSYESSVYSIFDLISELGGAFEIFEIACKFIIGYYVNKLFYHSIINSMNSPIDDSSKGSINSDKSYEKSTHFLHLNKLNKIIIKNRRKRYEPLKMDYKNNENLKNSKYDYFDFAYNLL